MKLIISLLLSFTVSLLQASPQTTLWFTQEANQPTKIHVNLFLSSTCAHCHKADLFFHTIEKKEPWLTVHRYIINEDKAALHTFYEQLRQQHTDNFAVPAMFFCDSRWIGFEDNDTTGKVLKHALTYCHQKIKQQGKLSAVTVNVLRRWASANQFQIDKSRMPSNALFVPLMALADSISPCSLFSLAAFLAFLWLYPTRKWLQVGVGFTFILSLGVIHYTQQTQSAFYYQYITPLKSFVAVVGLLLLLAVWRDWRKVASLIATKPRPLFFAIIMLTVFAIQVYQQTCTFDPSLIVEQWLAEQSLSLSAYVYYQVLYQAIYLLPLMLLLLFCVLLECLSRLKPYQQRFKMAACLILVCIGVIMVVYPSLLASTMLSAFVLFGAIIGGWFLNRP